MHREKTRSQQRDHQDRADEEAAIDWKMKVERHEVRQKMAQLELRYKILADRKRSPVMGRDTGRITRLPYTPFASITQPIRLD